MGWNHPGEVESTMRKSADIRWDISYFLPPTNRSVWFFAPWYSGFARGFGLKSSMQISQIWRFLFPNKTMEPDEFHQSKFPELGLQLPYLGLFSVKVSNAWTLGFWLAPPRGSKWMCVDRPWWCTHLRPPRSFTTRRAVFRDGRETASLLV